MAVGAWWYIPTVLLRNLCPRESLELGEGGILVWSKS